MAPAGTRHSKTLTVPFDPTARGVAAGEAMRETVRDVEAEWAERLGEERFAVLRDLLASLDSTDDPGRGPASDDSGSTAGRR